MALAVFATGCASAGPDPAEVDQAFISGMALHHEEAVEMAELASHEAEHPELRELAHHMVEAQEKEIKKLTSAYEDNFDADLPHDVTPGLTPLGIPHAAAAIHAEMWMLEEAEEFDAEFIDMMIHHHQGAIRMARVMEKKGGDSDMKELATEIIESQSSEIRKMNKWRQE